LVETGWEVTGGKAVATTAVVGNAVYQTAAKGFAPIYQGQCIDISYDIDSITGSLCLRLEYDLTTQTTTGTKTQTRTMLGDATIAVIKSIATLTGNIDNLSIKVRTVPAATGALITSTKGGATRAWKSNTLTNPDGALTYKVMEIR
jgi:hypothetical protein